MKNIKDRPYFHKSVLVNEVIEYLNIRPGKIYLDATFGGGGHTQAILDAQPTCTVIALDWDHEAIEKKAPPLKEQYGDRFKIHWTNFAQVYRVFKKEKIATVDGVIADFGTSQYQIHSKAGFSFQTDTPLDMRMSPAHQRTTAAILLNEAPLGHLIKIFREYGQDPYAVSIAKRVVLARTKEPFQTTGQLVDLIESMIPHFKAMRGIHPATRIFQALRIEVNQELDNILLFLKSILPFIGHDGRLVCISFHSLEDRIVKTFFREHSDQLKILTPKPITASPEELAVNLSSRSAKLRAAQRI